MKNYDNSLECMIIAKEKELENLEKGIQILQMKYKYRKDELKVMRKCRPKNLQKLNNDRKHELVTHLMYMIENINIDEID